MKQNIIKGLFLALLAITAFACKDDLEYGPLVRDNKPAVPVMFPGATTWGGNPFIEVSAAGAGAIKFTLEIPSSTGRTIKEITKVAGGGTAINAASLNTAAAVINAAPIAGSGTTAVFQTTLNDFKTKFPGVSVAPGTPTVPREIAYIFLVTLDDNSQIVTQQVRVRVIP
ncbi:hypothetical protein IC229_10150 [Spirosoma sp. BT702]|uniref:DUF1735 domain-containing protein n=1 Tax=Spirosoma profusum TaxID=2771354 RepID=A0A926XZC3_9BACT|nr:hypothetical protein [Spirosoma profusum]MBD2700997.1 hypothetical protein [Spirosoma profusum]